MDPLRISMTIMACVLPFAGCARKSAPPAAPAAAKAEAKPGGRLVPAVLAGFERGAGGWKSEAVGAAGAPLAPPAAESGGAAKGQRWLAQGLTVPAGETRTLNVYGDVPAQDWSRFGDTVRASVRSEPGDAKIAAALYVVTADQKTLNSPEQSVSGEWSTLVWEAGDAVRQVTRIGVRFTVTGPFTGRLGLDNVRIGAKDALAAAWTVAYGPYPSRRQAVDRMADLKVSGIESYPLYEQGWYLGLGTFSTHKAAQAEAQRFETSGMMTTILER